MKILRIAVFFSFVLILGVSSSMAQSPCRGFAKKYCRIDLGDFIHNGQALSAEINTGESAEIGMVFYNKHDYRIIVCSEDHLGEVSFKILDAKGNVLFDNRDHGMTPFWDFGMTATKRLVIEVSAPSFSSGDDALDSGCVALIIGHKISALKGFR